MRKSVKYDSLATWSRDFRKRTKAKKEALFWKAKVSQKKEAQRMCIDMPNFLVMA